MRRDLTEIRSLCTDFCYEQKPKAVRAATHEQEVGRFCMFQVWISAVRCQLQVTCRFYLTAGSGVE